MRVSSESSFETNSTGALDLKRVAAEGFENQIYIECTCHVMVGTEFQGVLTKNYGSLNAQYSLEK